MFRRLLLLLAVYGFMSFHPAFAVDEFRKNNPDIKKYEFARSYITALSYLKDIDDRWNKKVKLIKASINDLALDNTDLRIIKNYLVKYLASPNALIRRVANMVVKDCVREIDVNDQEKVLWEKWNELNTAGQATRPKEIEFVKAQRVLALKRKDINRDIVQATVLMTKVLISDKNVNGRGHRLAVTAQQRQKLLDKLDSYGRDTLDWGLKPGQRSLEASIAVIREILEDSIWLSIDEK
ncbi:MAG: hypothetical protein HQL14_04580 [Candidatus Omnitrophica bacterium]|nr:hypothetical protein [Candidatus Omnitrophota bacterium]